MKDDGRSWKNRNWLTNRHKKEIILTWFFLRKSTFEAAPVNLNSNLQSKEYEMFLLSFSFCSTREEWAPKTSSSSIIPELCKDKFIFILTWWWPDIEERKVNYVKIVLIWRIYVQVMNIIVFESWSREVYWILCKVDTIYNKLILIFLLTGSSIITFPIQIL